MAHNVQVQGWRHSGRMRLFVVAAIAVLLPLAIVALSRLQADDHTVAAGAAVAGDTSSTAPPPALMPLPPMQRAAKPLLVAPPGAASTTASDDRPHAAASAPANSAVPLASPPAATPASAERSAALPSASAPATPLPATPVTATPLTAIAPTSTNLPPITIPPPIHVSAEPPQSTAIPADPAPHALHVEVIPLDDWASPAAAPAGVNSTSPATTSTAFGPVTPASAAIDEPGSSSISADVASQSADDLPQFHPLAVATARFKEIEPGVTTSDELIQRWGDGKLVRRNDGVQRVYTLGHYPRVAVSLERGRVSAIDVQLDEPTEADALAQRLHFDLESSVPVLDDAGQPLGQSYPDHGTLFSYAPGTKLVSQMLLEPIDPQPFLLRASREGDLHPGWGLRDVDYALSLDPMHAESHDLRAQILLAIGRPRDALKSANRSLALSTDNAALLLSKATILARLDRHDEAIELAKSVVDRNDVSGLLRAHAFCQLAELTAGTPGGDKRAIDFYMSAIKTAQPLALDQKVAVRRMAKHLLLEAHLGAASDIAWGVWQKKPITVSRWIKQADQLAQDLIDHEDADAQVRFEVARIAISASIGTEGKWDAADWIEQLLDIGRKLIAETDDPLRKQCLEWELGAALVDALELQRTAGLNAQSLSHAMAMLRYLQSGIQYRQRTTETLYILGRAYFQIGVIHAVAEHDHAAAVAWFDRAVPLLDRPLPRSAGLRIGRNGELLVGMGISYWQTGNREEGLRLTKRGADLMTKAVAMKLLGDGALAAPYGNLAAMYRQMGRSDQARSYSEMAAQHDAVHR